VLRCGEGSVKPLQDFGIALILTAAVLGIYAQSFQFGAVRFDDGLYIAGSTHLQSGLSIDGIKWAFSENHGSNYAPLTLLSHMFDRDLFGDDLGGHHLTSVVIHAVNAILLFAALFFMTGARWTSAAAAMLFAVHPLNVESVAWIAERKNVLSTAFWILSMWAYAGYTRRSSLALYLCSVLLLAVGLLAKSMLVTLPLVFLLLDYWPLDRVRWGRRDAAGAAARPAQRSIAFLIVEKLPLLAICGVAIVATLQTQSRGIASAETIPLSSRVANAIVSYARYVEKSVWPADLTMHYPHPYVPQMGGEPLAVWQIAAAAALLIVLSGIGVLVVRRRYLLVGWLWFLGVLVPTIGFVQVGDQAFADRYAYVSTIGLFLAVSWLARDWMMGQRASRGAVFRIGLVVIAACLVSLSVASWRQVAYWRDTVTLFDHTLEVIPKNPKIRYNLANEYRTRGDEHAAIHNYRIALETETESVRTRVNLGNALRSTGALDEAVEMYEAALEREPKHANAHNSLGTVLRARGDIDGAILRYSYAIEINPDFYLAHFNLANALQAKGQYQAAVAHYMEALREQVRDANIFNNLGNAFVKLDRQEDAETAYRVAVEFNPNHYFARISLGALYARQGKLDEAIAQFRSAIETSPNFAIAHEYLGDALSAQGKAEEAATAYANTRRLDSKPVEKDESPAPAPETRRD
jgi:tetratricopeptide (TPR) repeat protein